jgi:hypothetical protein
MAIEKMAITSITSIKVNPGEFRLPGSSGKNLIGSSLIVVGKSRFRANRPFACRGQNLSSMFRH